KTSIFSHPVYLFLREFSLQDFRGGSVLQYQFDFGLRPSIGYSYSKALDVAGYKDSDRLNYIEIGTWYYFNKNMNVYTAYQINLLDKSDYVLAHGLNTDDQLAFGIVYQF
ncbi:porin, partial [Escherichia coli]